MREPRDIIGDHKHGHITDDQMLKELTEYDYTFGYCPVVDGYAMDAWEPGTWDQVESAYYFGDLAKEHFRIIFDHKVELIKKADEQ